MPWRIVFAELIEGIKMFNFLVGLLRGNSSICLHTNIDLLNQDDLRSIFTAFNLY